MIVDGDFYDNKGFVTIEGLVKELSKEIYVDHSATTAVRPEVLECMLPYFKEQYGNPSSIYRKGREAKSAIEDARGRIADCLHCKPNEIIFTGCGSEADNWAIIGTAMAHKNKGNHIITSAIEHHAVLHPCQYLEKQGYRVTYVGVDEKGILKLDELKEAICEDTILITVMMANNEIGTIQPIKEIVEIAKEKNITVHTDAVQALGQLEVDLSKLRVDMMSVSAHKFGGPKGVGFLFKRRGVRLDNFLHGGGQESGRRAGTENTASIIGMAKALELAVAEQEEHCKKMKEMRDKLIDDVLEKIPYAILNGDREQRLPGNANFSFRFVEGEALLLMLDMKGICASSGSACTSGSLDPSHVLLAIGLPHEIAHGSLRVSFGDDNTMEDVEYIVNALCEILARLRDLSPLYDTFLKEQESQVK